jgi:hypothetical protein
MYADTKTGSPGQTGLSDESDESGLGVLPDNRQA